MTGIRREVERWQPAIHGEPSTHLGHVAKSVRVEEILVEIGVEDVDLAVPLSVLGRPARTFDAWIHDHLAAFR